MVRSYRLAIAIILFSATLVAMPARGQPPARLPAGTETKDVPATDAQAQLMETVGLLSGLYLYQSYLNIGLLADGKAEKVYDEKAARAVLASVLTPLEKVDQQLAKVGKQTQTRADRDAVDRLRIIVTLLRQQGRDLTAFWDSSRPEEGTKYETTRKETWKQIAALLALEEKP